MARRISRGSTLAESTSIRVVDLNAYRRQRSWRNARNVYYLNESGSFLEALSRVHGVRILDIRSLESLAARLMTRRPDLVLVEAGLNWADALSMVSQLETLHGATVVLICGEADAVDSSWIKQAYASGASDTLFNPSPEDLTEAIDVLLKMQWATVEQVR